jgi:hypothetical protein
MSFVVEDSFSSSGSSDRPNEDAFGVSGEGAWIIDGATGLAERVFVAGPGESDASWLAGQMNAIFSALSSTSDPPRGVEFFARARAEIVDLFTRRARLSPQGISEWPCAATARVYRDGDDLCCESLDDCTILLRRRDGGVETLGADPAHVAIDARSVAELLRLRREGILTDRTEILGARSLLMPVIREGRARVNAPGGYGCFTLGAEIRSEFLRTRSFPRDLFTHVLLMTDGFYALVEDYRQATDEDLFARALSEGLESLTRALRATEDSDPHGVRWPRLKKSDDATAVLLRVDA